MGKKLLIVDDEQDFLDSITFYLQAKGFEVETAADGVEALKKIQAGLPDLAVIDLILPKLDGWRVAKRLKESSPDRRIPVLMLSALVSRAGEPEMWEVGDYYLSKPVTPEGLLAKIQGMLGEEAR